MKNRFSLFMILLILGYAAISQNSKNEKLLRDGIIGNDSVKIKEAISAGATPAEGLFAAVELNNKSYVLYFIKAGADPSVGLMRAILNDNLEITRLLLDHQAKFRDETITDIDGQVYMERMSSSTPTLKTPVYCKKKNGMYSWFMKDEATGNEIGVDRKVAVEGYALYYKTRQVSISKRYLINAIDNNNPDMVELLLKYGINAEKSCLERAYEGLNYNKGSVGRIITLSNLALGESHVYYFGDGYMLSDYPTVPAFMIKPLDYAILKNADLKIVELLSKAINDESCRFENTEVTLEFINQSDSILVADYTPYGIELKLKKYNPEVFGVKVLYSTGGAEFKVLKNVAFPVEKEKNTSITAPFVSRCFAGFLTDSVKPAKLILNLDINAYGKFTDARDGQQYKTVNIGGQVLMAENLRYKTPKGCWENNNKKGDYGYLYTWEAANSNLPDGWHVASMDEWEAFFKYLQGNEDLDIARKAMQVGGGSGFDLQKGGTHNITGFSGRGDCDYFWSSEPGCVFFIYTEFSSLFSPVTEHRNCVREDTKIGCSVRLFKNM